MMKTISRKPTTPGEYLRAEIIEPRGTSINDFADEIGIAKTLLYNVINGKARITPKIAVKLAEVVGTKPGFWIRMQAEVDAFIADDLHRKKQRAS
jgi:addiction module HigA family antidote